MTYTNANALNLFVAGICFAATLAYAFAGFAWLCLMQLILTLLNLGMVYIPKMFFK